jgi:flagellar M-ring protein FliF
MPTSFKQFAEIWRRLKSRERAAIIVASFATLALIGALIFYATRPEYAVLFSDLRPADAQAIIEKLKQSNVPYQVSNGGTTISVPAERLSELRLQIAASGVLSGGHVGFDLFDRNNFGATDFTQQVNYQRALEGELARTLEGMEEVEAARVHITRPRESLFTDKAERAKASVMLRVRQGHELSRERTEAIVALVSSAVEGLDPQDVSVMDTRGRILSAPLRDGVGGAAAFNSHLEARRQLESEMASRIVSLLEPITGPGHVRADVAADVDFSQIEQTEEKYDPKSAVIRSQQTSQEIRNTTNPQTSSVVGTRANDPSAQPTPQPAAAQATIGEQRTMTATNYEIDRLVRKTTGNGGRISRLSVSVLVDYKNANGVSVARTDDELKKIQDLVAAAVGIDPARGDQVVVQTIPFDQPSAETHQPTWLERYRDLVHAGIKYGALVFVALLILLFVIRPARRALRVATAPEPPLLPAGAAALAGEASLPPAGAQAELPASPRTVAELEAEMEAANERRELREEVPPEVLRAAEIKRQLIEQSRSDPELVAMTIRSWLQETVSTNPIKYAGNDRD